MRTRQAFTLIELLVVIVIIGVLVGILLPAFARARQRAKRTQASSEAAALQNAIKAYFQEYNEWPVQGVSGGSPYVLNNYDVIKNLRPDQSSTNPKRIAFLEEENFRIKDDVIVNPWGNPYRIEIEPNYPPGTPGIPEGVRVSG